MTLKKRATRTYAIAILGSLLFTLTVGGVVVALLPSAKQAVPSDPFAGSVPRTPCLLHAEYDLVRREKYGTPLPQLDNPDYCRPLPSPSCKGTHNGTLHVRYSNTTLLRTGTATLDIATDDGSALGQISIGPISNVAVDPGKNLTYSGDSTAQFVLTTSKPVGANESYSGEQSLRQLTHPLAISIKAWCGQRSYNATIEEKLKIYDTITQRTHVR
jgi:hypothetical protein